MLNPKTNFQRASFFCTTLPMSLRIDLASENERQALWPLRAAAFMGPLSEAQYLGRNRRLFSHRFGRERVQTFVLRNDVARICASMDILQISLLARVGEAGPVELPGILLASVLTAPEDRKNGYATTLISKFFDKAQTASGVLYSDIGPPFYERFGFRATPVRAREIAAVPGAGPPVIPLPFERGVKDLQAIRLSAMAQAPAPSATVLPDAVFLDWHTERFRYFAECAGRSFSASPFWSVAHGEVPHLVLAAPNFITDRLEALWVQPGCEQCQAALSGIAASFGLRAVFFWDKSLVSASGKTECPMVRLAEVSGPVLFEDPQYCDSW